MKIASYSHDGTATYGVVDGGGLIDMAPRLGAKYPTLKSVIEAGALLDAEDAAQGQKADHRVDDVTLLPVIPDPGKTLCIGLNYRTHVVEGGRDVPEQPMIFVRFPESQVGGNQPLVRPKASEMFDFEGEMAVIIGTKGRPHPRSGLTYLYCRLFVFQRRIDPRLAASHQPIHTRQELLSIGIFRPVDGDGGRSGRPGISHTGHTAQR